MALDFRANQVRTSKLIASGSTGTNASLLIYPIAADGTPAGAGNINPAVFGTGSIGSDTFLYVSGTKQGSLTTLFPSTGKHVVFGGDAWFSGTIGIGPFSAGNSFYFGNRTIFTKDFTQATTDITLQAGLNIDFAGGSIDLFAGAGFDGGHIRGRAGDTSGTFGTPIGGYVGFYAGTGSAGLGAGDVGGAGGRFDAVGGEGGSGFKDRAGDGGNVSFFGGAGGIGSSGGGVGGHGGLIIFVAGPAQAGSTTSGHPGNVIIGAGSSSFGGGVVSIGDKQYGLTKNIILGGQQSTTASLGKDTYLFVSGAISSIGSALSGTAVFGGDVVVSGTLKILNGQVTGRLPAGFYTSTTNLSGSPQVCGQNFWDPSEAGYASGLSSIVLRAIMSTTTGSNIAYMKMFNVTNLVYVEIGGAGQTIISSSATTPTKKTSANLVTATGFSTTGSAIYEIQLYSSSSSSPAILGSAEILTS